MTRRSRSGHRTQAWYGLRVYDWRPAPFGRIRKVPPREVRRWTGSAERRHARPVAAWRDLAPQLAAWDAAGVTVAEQAAQLGLRRTQLAGIRTRLIREGLLVARSRRGRAWSAEDEHKLIDLVEQGRSYDELARRFKRSRHAVVLKCKRMGIRVTTTLATLAALDVAKLLGKGCAKSVTGWIKQGWLTARNAGGAGHKALWRITWDDLTAFMENPAYWLAWDPARITDRTLRAWAQELRAHEPRYLTQGEVAARYHVTVSAVGAWLDKGWLPAHRIGRCNRLIAESDLAGWTPPCERPRAGIPRGVGRRLVGGSGIVATEDGRFCRTEGCRRRAFYRDYCQACRAAARAAGVRIDDLGPGWRAALERKQAA